MAMAIPVSENRLLACLPSRDRARLMLKAVPRFLKVGTVLFEPGEEVDAVYFPLDGVVSLVTRLKNGGPVEVATVAVARVKIGAPSFHEQLQVPV